MVLPYYSQFEGVKSFFSLQKLVCKENNIMFTREHTNAIWVTSEAKFYTSKLENLKYYCWNKSTKTQNFEFRPIVPQRKLHIA